MPRTITKALIHLCATLLPLILLLFIYPVSIVPIFHKQIKKRQSRHRGESDPAAQRRENRKKPRVKPFAKAFREAFLKFP